jgi:hypothetical protein
MVVFAAFWGTIEGKFCVFLQPLSKKPSEVFAAFVGIFLGIFTGFSRIYRMIL